MKKKIEFLGVNTNNLKNIDVSLNKGEINLIVGPSGSGKTSLAYDTIAQIGQHELLSMYADDVDEPLYKVKNYTNMIATVPIKQVNNNNNPRSSIGTFSGLNKSIVFLFSCLNNVSEDNFSLDKEENVCDNCHGTGIVEEPDVNKLVSINIPIKNNPFRCWQRHKEFYSQIVEKVCREKNIDMDKSFFQLTKAEQEFLLSGESDLKYQIRFKKQGSFSSRTTKYYGVLTGKVMIRNFKIADRFYSEHACPRCKGERYADILKNYLIDGVSIGKFYTMKFIELDKFLDEIKKNNTESQVKYELEKISRYVKKAVEFNLGHLFFNRSIPSLSGGELQRLRMIQVFNSTLSDLLFILDEPLTGLSEEEKWIIRNNIISLVPSNTILIVDHSNQFTNNARNIITLGEGGGVFGGRLVDTSSYFQKENEKVELEIAKPMDYLTFKVKNNIFDFKGVNISIGKNVLNLLYGRSGIGKSTLLREYFPQVFENYLYVSQKAIVGNKKSSVSTVIGVFELITKLFADRYGLAKSDFSNQSGKAGVCPYCNGVGYNEYYVSFNNYTKVRCKKCDGTGFSSALKKYVINRKSIFDIWKMTIEESISFFEPLNKKIERVLLTAKSLNLGHLILGQSTGSLSGGENVRIKIMKTVDSNADIIGIDEPFKGLSFVEMTKVILYLEELRKQGKTVVVIDHEERVREFFGLNIEITTNKDGYIVKK